MPRGLNQFGHLGGKSISHSIGNINGGGASLDDLFQDLAKKIPGGASGVFRRKLHVLAVGLRQSDSVTRLLDTFAPRDLEFVLKVNVRGGEEYVDAGMDSSGERLPGSLDVIAATASQGSNHRPAYGARDGLHGMEISVGSNRKSGFDYIDTQPVEFLSQANFFSPNHAAARGLLSIAQGGVEYRYLLTG